MTTPKDNVLAFTWYRRDDYPKLLEASRTHQGLPDTYDDWLTEARQAFAKYEKMGFEPTRVPLDVDDYLTWCERRDRPVDARSRELYKEIRRRAFYRDLDGQD